MSEDRLLYKAGYWPRGGDDPVVVASYARLESAMVDLAGWMGANTYPEAEVALCADGVLVMWLHLRDGRWRSIAGSPSRYDLVGMRATR